MRCSRCSMLLMVLLSLGFVLVAQAQTSRDLSTGQRALAGTEWRLVSFGPVGTETDVIAGTTITLKFGEDGRISGSTGCNSYGGTYQVRGDTVSFSRLVSTRRACLDQNANQQEQRFLAALEAGNRFRLSGNRLTILSDRGRNVLNFVSDSASEPDDGPEDARNDPVAMLAAYYNAINSRNYQRAYRFWESPQSSYEQFVRGFADTVRVRLLLEPPARMEGAAGSSYTEIPTIIIATARSGVDRVFAGCYVMRRSNVRDDARWRIYRADISVFPSNARISRVLPQGCRNSQ